MIENLDKKVKTVILLMFENRSFDHMLGHLSLENINPQINGLKEPLEQYLNIFGTRPYYPYKLNGETPLTCDIPHEYDFVKTQISWNQDTNNFLMNGFVEAYAKSSKAEPAKEAETMGYFSSDQVPVTSFLARNYCTCDNWFCSLPTSTQPNRTMAFTGDSSIYRTGIQKISIKNNLFHWLNISGIDWRVYHDYISFFVLYPQLWDHMFGPKFCNYKKFKVDWQAEKKESDPRLIIIEPTYHDCPHFNKQPNDNHSPLSIGWGEIFLQDVYETIISNKDRWKDTVMIVYYDEHGGFYDHEPPPIIGYKTIGHHIYKFDSLGPRIPALIISPLVKKGDVCKSLFDHTSVLQFLTEVFTNGKQFSDNVELRKKNKIKSISEALNDETLSPGIPCPSFQINPQAIIGEDTIIKAPDNSEGMRQAFEGACDDLMNQRPADTWEKYPDLYEWKELVSKKRIK
jgi:phospholipase C